MQNIIALSSVELSDECMYEEGGFNERFDNKVHEYFEIHPVPDDLKIDGIMHIDITKQPIKSISEENINFFKEHTIEYPAGVFIIKKGHEHMYKDYEEYLYPISEAIIIALEEMYRYCEYTDVRGTYEKLYILLKDKKDIEIEVNTIADLKQLVENYGVVFENEENYNKLVKEYNEMVADFYAIESE